MPVIQRGSSFQATVNFKGERFRRQFPTMAEAETWEAKAKAALLKGELPDMGDGDTGGPATLEALRELTIKLKWKGTKGERTALQNSTICIRDLGNISPAKVTTQAVDALVFKWIDDGKSDATINRRLSALSTMLKLAHERGYIAAMPRIPRRKEMEGRIRYFTVEEERKILGWFEFTGSLDMAELVTVAIDTGMRRGELQRLEARDVEGDYVRVWKTKNNNKARSVDLTSRAKAILMARKERASSPTEKLFPMTDDSIRYAWDQMRFKVFPDDDQAVFHTLRHTYVSRLIQGGMPMKAVAVLAGHTTIKTTDRYSHLAPSTTRESVRVLEAMTQGQQ